MHGCLAQICAAANRSVLRISEEVATRLETHDWPGNFRELKNVLEYTVLSSDGPEITAQDLPPWFVPSQGRQDGIPNGHPSGFLGNLEVSATLDYYGSIERFEGVISSRRFVVLGPG